MLNFTESQEVNVVTHRTIISGIDSQSSSQSLHQDNQRLTHQAQ